MSPKNLYIINAIYILKWLTILKETGVWPTNKSQSYRLKIHLKIWSNILQPYEDDDEIILGWYTSIQPRVSYVY